MLKSLPGYFIVLCLLFFCSCTKKIYTHQQVMQSFHTKDDVLKQFGKPDEVKEGIDIEEWIYNRDKVSGPNKPAKQDTIIATNAISDTLKTTQAIKYNKYIRFIFDGAGNVAGYKTQGVDMSTTKKDNFGMGLLKVLGITALIIIVVGLDIYNNSDINI
jgi:hypothetical protein